VQWTTDLETGDQTVDDQHKEIFRLVGQVLETESQENKKEKAEAALQFLSAYVLSHFATEEALMDECDYPNSIDHKGEHNDFVHQVVEYMALFSEEGDSMSVSDAINGLVYKWLDSHIKGSDKDLADFYKGWKLLSNV